MHLMEENGFDELDQAAVAGAEGTAWSMPEFSACPLSTVSPFHPFSPASPFDSFSSDHSSHPTSISTPIPIPTISKEEPQYLDVSLVPSSPPQPSLCSVESEEDFNNKKTTNKTMVKPEPIIKTNHTKKSFKSISSPVSTITKTGKNTRNSIAREKANKSSSLLDLSVTTNDFSDLKGTTAARSRKMTEEERKIMLHKRRLRNRASAARSREKRSRTLTDLTAEVEDLMKKATLLAKQASDAIEETRKLKAKNILLMKENELLKSELKM